MVKFKRLLKSFKYAGAGLKKVFWEEQNFRVQLVITLIVLILAITFTYLWQRIQIIKVG